MPARRNSTPKPPSHRAREPREEANPDRARPVQPGVATKTDRSSQESGVAFSHALDFVAFVSRALPLTGVLDGLPERAARVLKADVVSVYLLEGHGDGLVLRGNVGFGRSAQGTIRLKVGEGITGLAVERGVPLTFTAAPVHDRFRRFDQLDEDRYPVFLAVPVVGPDRRPLGALVAQRKSGAFSAEEIVTATMLTAPIALAVRNAALLDELRDKPQRKTGGGTRKVTLPGRPIVSGRGLGGVSALRRPAKDRKMDPRPEDAKLIDAAFDTVEKALRALELKAVSQNLVGATSFFASYGLIASDGRLKERALELIAEGKSAAEALSTVAREVTRAATGIVGHPFLEERARDIEDLCDAILMLAAPDARAEIPKGAILLGEQVSVFDLLVTQRSMPSGVALTQPASARSEVILQLMGVPAISEVGGAFRWASPGDVALLDADHGFFIINPSRAEISRLRAWRKSSGERREELSLPESAVLEMQGMLADDV